MSRDHAFFQNVPVAPHPTSGGDVDLPIFFYESTSCFLLYLAPAAAVKSLLGHEALEPALTMNGRVLVSLACFEYRDSSIGSYNEVGLALSCREQGGSAGWLNFASTLTRPAKRGTALHVVDLPVTTERACSAGIELWGLPKFVGDIGFEKQGRHFSCSVSDAKGTGKNIFSVTGKHGLAVPTPSLGMSLLSSIDGKLLRTIVDVAGKTRVASGGSVTLSLGDSSHPFRERLEALGLNGKSPLAVLYNENHMARMNAGAFVS